MNAMRVTVRNRRIYVASSWRNAHQPAVVDALREAGHEVYDFRNPAPGQKGFAWRDCGGLAAEDGPGTGARTIPAYLEAVASGRARAGFALDKEALDWCDTCVLVLPCGRSAHLEAGYAAGRGKDVLFLLHEDAFEPELMYLLGGDDACVTTIDQVIARLAEGQPYDVMRWHIESGGHFARPGNHAVRLLREVVELCIAAGASMEAIEAGVAAELDKAAHHDTFGPYSHLCAAEEAADVSMLLEAFCGHASIDLHAERREKLAVLWERAWEADDGGALYRPGHVPGGES